MTGPWEAFQDAPADAGADPKGPWSDFHAETGAPLSWGDVAVGAAKNAVPSTISLLSGIASAVAHPINTAEGLYNVGKGAVSKAAGAIGIEQDPAAKEQNEAQINALRDFYVNRYGSMEGFKKALSEDPAGIAADLSTIFAGPELALSRAPGALAKVGEVSGNASRLANPLTLAGKAVSKTAAPLSDFVLGQATGAGGDAIRQAARAGYQGSRTFVDNMRGNVPPSDIVDLAKGAVGDMRQQRGAAYRQGMDAIKDADKYGYVLSYAPINDALKKAQDMVYFNGLSKSDEAASTLNKIQSKVDEWGGAFDTEQPRGPKDWVNWAKQHRSVESMDALKQAIGEIRQKTQPGTLERRVADSIYNAAKSSIVEQAPAYAATMKDYANASDQIKELERTFSLGEKATTDTALRKLQSTMRNNVNTNYGQRTAQMQSLADLAPELPNAIAGQQLNSWAPRGLARTRGIELGSLAALTHFINPAALAAIPFSSPRLVGEAAYAAGRAARKTRAPSLFNILPDVVQKGYPIGILSGGIGPRYDENGNLLPGQ
jgi:hypothetical protein